MSRGIEIRMSMGEAVLKATRDIDGYTSRVQTGIVRTIANGTQAVYSAAVRMAPRGPTGNLKAGLTYRLSGVSGMVMSRAPHSHLVEFGTEPRITYRQVKKGTKHAMRLPDGRFVKGDIYNGRMPKKPFMRPAYMTERDNIEAQMKKVITDDTG